MAKIMEKEQYIPRIIDAAVERYLATIGAVCIEGPKIEGPKWCGKTWTSSYHSNSEFLVGNPDNNFQNRALAEMSPALVLEGETPRLIDEWQEVPPLWDAVRYIVDQRGKKGQFILTGSATPKACSTAEPGGSESCGCAPCLSMSPGIPAARSACKNSAKGN